MLLAEPAAAAGQQTLPVDVDDGAGAGLKLANVQATYYAPTPNVNGRQGGGIVALTGQLQELQGVPLEAVEIVVNLVDPLGDKTRRATFVYRAVAAGGVAAIDDELEAADVKNYRVRIRPIRVKRPSQAQPRIVFPQGAGAVAVPVSWESVTHLQIGSAAGSWDDVTRRLRLQLTATPATGLAGAELVVTPVDVAGEAGTERRVAIIPAAAITVDVELAEAPATARVHVGRLRYNDGRVNDGRTLELEARNSPNVEIRDLAGTCGRGACSARYTLAAVLGQPAAVEIEMTVLGPFGDEVLRERRTFFELGPASPRVETLPAEGWSLVVSIERVRLANGTLWERPPLLGMKPDWIQ